MLISDTRRTSLPRNASITTFPDPTQQRLLITKCNSKEQLRARRRNFVSSVEMDIQAYMACILLYEARSICLHRILWSAQHRGLHHGQGICQVLTSTTIMKVRRSTLIEILNIKTKKATTNIRSTMTRRRITPNTTKHSASNLLPTCPTKTAVSPSSPKP